MSEKKAPKINDGLKVVNEAKEIEKNGNYSNAAQKYKEAEKIFKGCDASALYAKCLAARYVNMIKFYLEGRNVEGFSYNLIEYYINKIVSGIKEVCLKKFDEHELLISTYRELEKIYGENNMDEKANDMYYKRTKLYYRYFWRRAIKKSRELPSRIKDVFKSFLNLLFFWFCGHGERPLRALLISIFVILLFSGLYCIPNLILYSSLSPGVDYSFGLFQGFYFSIVTFTTLGFGDFVPKNSIGQTFVVIEVMLGYFMLGATK
jgi:hypothetical protein